MRKPSLQVLLASPRGFCAGVVRALDTVERALEAYGPPLYVHHEIVHNPHVVADLAERGVIFVETLDAVPPGGRLIISAHGASPKVFSAARARGLRLVDGTCPLVTKVHNEVANHAHKNHQVILIGHRGHAEIVGTRGHASDCAEVIESVAEAEALPIDTGQVYAYATQTTLAIEETSDIVSALRRRIPGLIEPLHSDICYATTNRQTAIKAMAPRCDGIIVVGGANSSNSQRMVEVARLAGCKKTWLVSRGSEFDVDASFGLRVLGISSGASTPEPLVNELILALRAKYEITLETVETAIEREHYNLPSLSPFDAEAERP